MVAESVGGVVRWRSLNPEIIPHGSLIFCRVWQNVVSSRHEPATVETGRVDDIPVLLTYMHRMGPGLTPERSRIGDPDGGLLRGDHTVRARIAADRQGPVGTRLGAGSRELLDARRGGRPRQPPEQTLLTCR